MALKWSDYLRRKGMTAAQWIDANSISSIDGLRIRLNQVGITMMPDDAAAGQAALSRHRSSKQARSGWQLIGPATEHQDAAGGADDPSCDEPNKGIPAKKRRRTTTRAS